MKKNLFVLLLSCIFVHGLSAMECTYARSGCYKMLLVNGSFGYSHGWQCPLANSSKLPPIDIAKPEDEEELPPTIDIAKLQSEKKVLLLGWKEEAERNGWNKGNFPDYARFTAGGECIALESRAYDPCRPCKEKADREVALAEAKKQPNQEEKD